MLLYTLLYLIVHCHANGVHKFSADKVVEGGGGEQVPSFHNIDKRAANTITAEIKTTWNGGQIDHNPVKVTLSKSQRDDHLTIKFDAPYFGKDPMPPSPPGKPLWRLWDYEVAEIYFLNDDNEYLEVELGPHGQHLVLLLHNPRNITRHSLPVDATTTITGNTWTGTLEIPLSYFPPKVTRYNVFAMHLPEPNRHRESLFPSTGGEKEVEFHRLQYFQPLDLNTIIPRMSERQKSKLWEDSLNGLFRYKIDKEWNGTPVIEHTHFEFTLQKDLNDGIRLKITAPFYNDPKPPNSASKGPYRGLWDYEVFEVYFLNEKDEYLQLMLSPNGQHYVLLFQGERDMITHSLPLDFDVTTKAIGMNNLPGIWKASALIPSDYFPPNVTRMNSFAMHGVEDSRVWQALYPVPKNHPDHPIPDFHKLGTFEKIDFDLLVPPSSDYSDLWKKSYAEHKVSSTTVASTTSGSATLSPIRLLLMFIFCLQVYY